MRTKLGVARAGSGYVQRPGPFVDDVAEADVTPPDEVAGHVEALRHAMTGRAKKGANHA
jgi:hypothetical protein